MNRLTQKITENLKKKDLNQYQTEVLFFNLLNIYMNKNKIGDAKKLLADTNIHKDEYLQRRCEIISLLLDKKYDEALELTKQPQNTLEALYKAQIQIEAGKSKDVVDGLIKYTIDTGIQDARLFALLLQISSTGKFNIIYSDTIKFSQHFIIYVHLTLLKIQLK